MAISYFHDKRESTLQQKHEEHYIITDMPLKDSKKQYNMSFTTGGLFYNESILVVEEYLILNDWNATKKSVIENNAIQSRTKSSVMRRVREICSRLQLLSISQLTLIKNGSRSEQQYILWLAICKRFAFIHEFAVEIVREKFLRMDSLLTLEEYQGFFEAKARWHEKLDQLQKSTCERMRQVLFQILREAGIITDTHIIIPAILTSELVKAIIMDDPALLHIFPLSDMGIQTWLK